MHVPLHRHGAAHVQGCVAGEKAGLSILRQASMRKDSDPSSFHGNQKGLLSGKELWKCLCKEI